MQGKGVVHAPSILLPAQATKIPSSGCSQERSTLRGTCTHLASSRRTCLDLGLISKVNRIANQQSYALQYKPDICTVPTNSGYEKQISPYQYKHIGVLLGRHRQSVTHLCMNSKCMYFQGFHKAETEAPSLHIRRPADFPSKLKRWVPQSRQGCWQKSEYGR